MVTRYEIHKIGHLKYFISSLELEMDCYPRIKKWKSPRTGKNASEDVVYIKKMAALRFLGN